MLVHVVTLLATSPPHLFRSYAVAKLIIPSSLSHILFSYTRTKSFLMSTITNYYYKLFHVSSFNAWNIMVRWNIFVVSYITTKGDVDKISFGFLDSLC